MPVKILETKGHNVLVGDMACRYGDNGSGLPPFAPDTDYMLDFVPRKMVLLDHAETGNDDILGAVIHEKRSELGIYAAAMLDSSLPAVIAMLPDIRRGLYGWSAGCLSKLYKADGQRLKRFPIYEYSLTKWPRDPRNLGKPVSSTPLAPPKVKFSFDYRSGVFWCHDRPYSKADVMALDRAHYSISISSAQALDFPEMKHLYLNLK